MFFESHAHLYFDHYDEDRDKLLNDLFSSEIEGIINVGVDIETSYQSIKLAEKYEKIYAAVGLHPTDLKSNSDDEINVSIIDVHGCCITRLTYLTPLKHLKPISKCLIMGLPAE